MTWGAFSGNLNNRRPTTSTVRARGYITADAREQTAYGTARGYIAVGISTNDVGVNTAANTFSSNRAFVQWAGMTAGLDAVVLRLLQRRRPRTTAPAIYRSPIPATAAGGSGPTPRSSVAAYRRRSRRKTAARRRSSTKTAHSLQSAVQPTGRLHRCGLFTTTRAGATTRHGVTSRPVPVGSGQRRLWRLAGAGHRRQSARRSGLG